MDSSKGKCRKGDESGALFPAKCLASATARFLFLDCGVHDAFLFGEISPFLARS
jgi:hypothetical protein